MNSNPKALPQQTNHATPLLPGKQVAWKSVLVPNPLEPELHGSDQWHPWHRESADLPHSMIASTVATGLFQTRYQSFPQGSIWCQMLPHGLARDKSCIQAEWAEGFLEWTLSIAWQCLGLLSNHCHPQNEPPCHKQVLY